jgi:hypothetical protein
MCCERSNCGADPIIWRDDERSQNSTSIPPHKSTGAQHRLGGSFPVTYQLALEDSKDDVQLYSRTNLLQIRQKFVEVMKNEPSPWPSESVLDNLVAKSEGLFIHATTAVQYIGDGKGSPQIKLQRVLRMHKGLDPLYAQVITDAQESEHFDTVMGSLMHLRQPLTVGDLFKLFGLDVSEIRMTLDGCHSILVIPEDDNKSVRLIMHRCGTFLPAMSGRGVSFALPLNFIACS